MLEAIQNQDDAALADELGDVLLQVVMHAAIASEHGSFDILSVTDGVSRKMIRRHPHIFAGAEAKDSQQVLKNWEEIKHAGKRSRVLFPKALRISPRAARPDARPETPAENGASWL